MAEVADLVSTAAEDSPEEVAEYKQGYDAGHAGRPLALLSGPYVEGWQDGRDDYELENEYYSPDNDCADWSW